jgi:hypothetical protein
MSSSDGADGLDRMVLLSLLEFGSLGLRASSTSFFLRISSWISSTYSPSGQGTAS